MKCRVMYSVEAPGAPPPATGAATQRQAPAPGSPAPATALGPLRPARAPHAEPCHPAPAWPSRPGPPEAPAPVTTSLLSPAQQWSTAFRQPHAAVGPDPPEIGLPACLTLLSCESLMHACVRASIGVPGGVPVWGSPIPNSASVADFMGVMGGSGHQHDDDLSVGRLRPSARAASPAGGSRDGAGVSQARPPALAGMRLALAWRSSPCQPSRGGWPAAQGGPFRSKLSG